MCNKGGKGSVHRHQIITKHPGVKYPPLWLGVKAASGPEWLMLSREFVEYVQEGVLDED